MNNSVFTCLNRQQLILEILQQQAELVPMVVLRNFWIVQQMMSSLLLFLALLRAKDEWCSGGTQE